MLKLFRPGAMIAIAVFGVLVGCASSSPPSTPPAAVPALTINTPVDVIVANPAGKAVLDKDFPGLTTNANYGLIKSMSLKSLEPLSGGKMTDAELGQAQSDLAQIPAAP